MSKRLTLNTFLRANPVIYRIPVQWGDMDAFKHVNNVQYFKYQEGARIKYFDELLKTLIAMNPTEGPNFARNWHGAFGIGPILAHTELSYKFPVTYPDKLLVGASVDPASFDSSTGKRMIMKHDIWSLRHNRVVASGTGSVVTYDYATNKIIGAPEQLLHALQELEQNRTCEYMQESLENEREETLPKGA